MWQAIGASVRGTSHLRQDMPCQDICLWQAVDDYLVAAVADGLGSARFADEAARLAVESIVAYLTSRLSHDVLVEVGDWQILVNAAFAEARSRLVECAKAANQSLHDFATTLLVLVLAPSWLVTGHIGDGAIVVQFDDGRLETISPPTNGEYVNSVTPLTADDYKLHIRVRVERTAVDRAALLTDGLQLLCINLASMVPYAPFFIPLFEAIGGVLDADSTTFQLIHFLESERVSAKTDDDKTLVIIGRLSPSPIVPDAVM